MSEYLPVAITLGLAAVIVAAMTSLNRLLGPRGRRSAVKDETFECGNPATGSAWHRFSIKFYLVAILFIIFDVEVVFMYPWALRTLLNDIVEQARKSFDFRRKIPRDIPEVKESAVMGFSPEDLDLKRLVEGLRKGKIKGIAILSGSNNVKLTQDRELATIAQEFLKNDILCISEGEASVSLAKYGFLNPNKNDIGLGKGLCDLLSSIGKNLPSILHLGSSDNGGITDFLLGLAKAGKKEPRNYPILACFAEASRSTEVAEALWMVAIKTRERLRPFSPYPTIMTWSLMRR